MIPSDYFDLLWIDHEQCHRGDKQEGTISDPWFCGQNCQEVYYTTISQISTLPFEMDFLNLQMMAYCLLHIIWQSCGLWVVIWVGHFTVYKLKTLFKVLLRVKFGLCFKLLVNLRHIKCWSSD